MSELIKIAGKRLYFSSKDFPCAIGKSGFSANKNEGDGCTPIGIFPLRECWYRADRLSAPKTKLPLKIILENDGWCDDPKSKVYNRHIKIPPLPQGERGYENLWREDHAYDLIVPLGYNDDPVVAGRGSAIFLHVTHDDKRPTEGCVALAKYDLLAVLEMCDSGTMIEIRKG